MSIYLNPLFIIRCLHKCVLIFVAMTAYLSICLAQTTYYVAANGNDFYDGQSPQFPIRTLGRVNTILLAPGDTICFRRGDTFQGTLVIRHSGTASKPICVDAYGSGPKPTLSGALVVSKWTKEGPALWQANCSACSDRITALFSDGQALTVGRYPNQKGTDQGYLTIQAHTGNSQLTSQQSLSTDWSGAEAVLRPNHWIIDRAAISRQNGNTLTLTNPSNYELTDGWGFFIQNHPATLDQSGEWYYNPETKTMLLYADQEDPNNRLITAASVARGIMIENAAHITIQNLRVSQTRSESLWANNVSDLIIRNNDFIDSGEDGVIIQGTGRNLSIENNRIARINNNGLYVAAYQHVTIRNNTLKGIGLTPGSGKSGDGQMIGLQSFAVQNTLIEHNWVDSIGYNGISVASNSTVRQNQIAHFCMTKSDGGGVYLWNGLQQPMHTIRVESNIIREGIGTADGSSDNTPSGAHGIFLDDCVEGVEVLNNTVFDCQGIGIYMHAVSDVNLLGNTCFNNNFGQLILYNYGGLCQPRNNSLTQNIFMSKPSTQLVAAYISNSNDLASYGVMKNNYYARPFDDFFTIRTVYNRTVVNNLTLGQWQRQFGQDMTSKTSSLTYKDYTLKSLSKTSQLNCSFDTDTEGWEIWSSANNGRIGWDAGSHLTKGSLRAYFSPVTGTDNAYLLTYKPIQSVAQSKSYLLTLDLQAPADKKVVVFIRQRNAPYHDLTQRFELLASTVSRHYELALTALADENDALLAFQIGEDNQGVWFDNILLREAQIVPVNADEYIKFVYNPTEKDSLVVLNRAYRDVRNRYYTDHIRIAPFTSVVLLKDSLPPVDVSLTAKLDKASLKIGEVASLTISLQGSLSLPATIANEVQWSCLLPNGLTILNNSNSRLAYDNGVLSGTVHQLRADTTFLVRLMAVASGSFLLDIQVVSTTCADPDSSPDYSSEEGEDDEALLTLQVSDSPPADTVAIVTAIGYQPQTLPDDQLIIYPNPARREFTFVASDEIVSAQVTDMLGREEISLGPIRIGQSTTFGQWLTQGNHLLLVRYKSGGHQVVKMLKTAD